MQCGGPICILCLRDCDSSGSLSSCNHFFCARCVPRLPPANPPSAPPQCPICKKPYRLVSINSAAVQPLLQDPNSLFRILANQQQHQRQIILRMREALRILKEEVKATERKYREKSATLDRVLHHHQQQLQQQQRHSQSQMPHQQQQPPTPREQSSRASPFLYGGSLNGFLHSGGVGSGSGGGRANSLGFSTPLGHQHLPSSTHPQQPHQSVPMPSSLPIPCMTAGYPTPPPPQPAAPAPPAPLGWSATSAVLLPQRSRNCDGGNANNSSSDMSVNGTGAAGGSVGRVSAVSAAAGGGSGHGGWPQQHHEKLAFRLSTPLDRNTATPDLLWPR